MNILDAVPMGAPVPFVDLGLQNRRISADVERAFSEVVNSASFVLGPQVEQFEAAFASYSKARFCIGVANGTDAIELALRALDIGEGDEVILPANSFVATAEAVVRAGARVVLVDCDDNFLIDVTEAKAAVTDRTRAVVAVHLYGQMAPMGDLRGVLPPHVSIVEDAAQAQGASREGLRACSAGDIAATSFYPGKNLGAYGDAGAVLTDSPDLADTVRALRNHGGVRKYEHERLGMNSRMDSVQAAVLSIKLARLDEWNSERGQAACRYHALLGDLTEVVLPEVVPESQHVWHLYVVRVSERDRVMAILSAHGIGSGVHYPIPIHLLPAFAYLDQGPGSFPVAEALATQVLSLPMFPGLTEVQQERVATALRAAVNDALKGDG